MSSSTICCCRPRRPSVSQSRSWWSSRFHERVRAGVVFGQVRDPAADALQRRQRVGELAQRSGALGRATAVVDRFAPRLGVGKVMGEQGRQVGPAIRVTPLDGPSHHLVERAALPFEQAVVGDLLRQHMPEAIGGLGQDGGLLDQPRAFEPVERGRRIGAWSQHLAEQDAPELTPDHRGHTEHIPRIPIEAIEPGANDGLHRIGQPQHFDAAGRHRFAIVRRHRVFLEQRAAHLLEEERVATRPFVHTRGKRVGHPIDVKHGPHDRGRGIARERRELNARGAICTPGERARLRPARHHDHQRMRVDNLEKPAQRVARRLVGPVPVFEQHERRGPPCQRDDDRGQRLRQRHPEVLTLQMPRKRERLALHRQQVQIQRHERFEGGIDRARPGDDIVGAVLLRRPSPERERVVQNLDKGDVRRHSAGRAAPALEDLRAGPAHSFTKFIEQPALAGAGFADHGRDPSLSAARLQNLSLQRRQFGIAAGVRRQVRALRRLQPRLQS